ncbi:chondroitinase-B domain-containing protein [Flavivirga aquimarina]|uniref:Chondroitinase-B domain-containing protein n=1 Tax=Flavivirga aquimarina TaxID=2027862 RepID=A0ABT8W7E4_9FLAO|nr:chondroitinase-B domain-containing protein [Flavivirga aquimarina]MDO5969023.1 chondroitinase-B domain-containing protein [Flavivirga aquimarina]
MNKILFHLLLLFSLSVAGQTTYNITDPESLRDVIYEPGDVIILKNGTYTTDERIIFLGSGTADNPVTFRAETPGGVIFTGGPRLTIGGETDDDTGDKIATGEYLIVDGFHWKGGYGASNFIEFRNGDNYAHHSTIQNCAIDGLGIEPDELTDDLADEQIPKHRWIVLYGTYNTVINCSFMNKVSAGAIVLGEYAYNAFPNVPDGEPEINNSCAIVGHTITNNYFYNYKKITELYPFTKANGDPYSNSGDSETIRIGTSSYQMVNSNATVSNNYFVQSDGENEIITNKSKGNTYTNNTFRKCRGSLVLRHGSHATVDGNYFLGEDVEGTGGIRITDSEHTITNNYIQDCITVASNAKWNNGITFMGGSEDADVACNTKDVSSGYQESKNINLSNNTIINTNAPLFYNEDKGSEDPTGTVSNNLIYFATSDPNLTDIISGDSASAFDNLGTALTYTGNVYTGTSLGATTTGFSEEAGITATADGEIFTFSGAGSDDKGAVMGSYEPTTDAMVGYGIGTCFLDYAGDNIIDGDCTIEVVESLTISSLTSLSPEAASYDVTVNANVSWTAVSSDTWITININSGTGNETVSVTVTENADINARAGTVTFTQDPGGDDIERVLNVTQNGADLTDLYDLINTGTGLPTDKVTVHSFSKENSSKDELAIKSLDKDMDTEWTADDGAVLPSDYKGDGEYVIYDLGGTHHLDMIQFNTTNKSDAFGIQIWVSTTGTDPSDFTTKILPTSGDLLFTATNTTDFNQYLVDADARYVKLIGYGRFNSAGDNRESPWTAITEIEFYGSESLSVDEADLNNSIVLYPMPAKNILYVKNSKNIINDMQIYSLDGRSILKKTINSTSLEIDTSLISNGTYIINLSSENHQNISKMIIVSH